MSHIDHFTIFKGKGKDGKDIITTELVFEVATLDNQDGHPIRLMQRHDGTKVWVMVASVKHVRSLIDAAEVAKGTFKDDGQFAQGEPMYGHIGDVPEGLSIPYQINGVPTGSMPRNGGAAS